MLLIVSLLMFASVASFCAVLRCISQPLFSDLAVMPTTSTTASEQLPAAAVILCVRGADPTLPACLKGLLNQDYGQYEIHIVLDSEHDPAANIVNEAVAEDCIPKVNVHILRKPDARRGLKVSAILQALKSISENVEAVAFLDADAKPGPLWLRHLVSPLREDEVGATSGLRWFEADCRGAGSQIRAKWNLYALVLMRWCNIPWGGSLAIRRDVLRSTAIQERWSETVCEDTCVGDVLSDVGLKVQLVPDVLMVNREQTTLVGCWRFMVRQLVFTRLHSKNWWPIALFGQVFAALAVLFPCLGAAAIATQNSVALSLIGAAFTLMVSVVDRFEKQIRIAAYQCGCGVRDETLAKRRFAASWISDYVCRTACVIISGMAILTACFTRQLHWRGITYRIRRSQITIQEYRPFVSTNETDAPLSQMSI